MERKWKDAHSLVRPIGWQTNRQTERDLRDERKSAKEIGWERECQCEWECEEIEEDRVKSAHVQHIYMNLYNLNGRCSWSWTVYANGVSYLSFTFVDVATFHDDWIKIYRFLLFLWTVSAAAAVAVVSGSGCWFLSQSSLRSCCYRFVDLIFATTAKKPFIRWPRLQLHKLIKFVAFLQCTANYTLAQKRNKIDDDQARTQRFNCAPWTVYSIKCILLFESFVKIAAKRHLNYFFVYTFRFRRTEPIINVILFLLFSLSFSVHVELFLSTPSIAAQCFFIDFD